MMSPWQRLHARWIVLPPRERMALIAGATVLGTVGLWSVLLSPALSTLRKTEAQHRVLDAQLQKMQALRGTALALQAQPKPSREATVRALEQTIQSLGGGARWTLNGDQLTLTLKQIPAPALADWLIQSRERSGLQASEIRMTRPAAGEAVWDGTLIFILPPD